MTGKSGAPSSRWQSRVDDNSAASRCPRQVNSRARDGEDLLPGLMTPVRTGVLSRPLSAGGLGRKDPRFQGNAAWMGRSPLDLQGGSGSGVGVGRSSDGQRAWKVAAGVPHTQVCEARAAWAASGAVGTPDPREGFARMGAVRLHPQTCVWVWKGPPDPVGPGSGGSAQGPSAQHDSAEVPVPPGTEWLWGRVPRAPCQAWGAESPGSHCGGSQGGGAGIPEVWGQVPQSIPLRWHPWMLRRRATGET